MTSIVRTTLVPIVRTLLAALLLAVLMPSAADAGKRNKKGQGDDGRVVALLLNGGHSAAKNYQSHLLHLQDMRDALLARGLSADDITVFCSDGGDPGRDMATKEPSTEDGIWLLQSTHVDNYLLPQTKIVNTEWADVEMRPATQDALRDWFETQAPVLTPDDTVFVYVTDHGGKGKEDLDNGNIRLWEESVDVVEFRALLDLLPAEVQVVTVMSQCYSGTFANAMLPTDAAGTTNRCGFYSAPRHRRAYGCYPEGREKNLGHGYRFTEALSHRAELAEAHTTVVYTDRTPDVPLSTSDVYRSRLLDEEAERREVELDALMDELLAVAWADAGPWEPEIRLLDDLAQAYGIFSPRSIEDLDSIAGELPSLTKKMKSYRDEWEKTLENLRKENLQQFVAAHPAWADRLDAEALKKLGRPARNETLDELLPAFVAWTESQPETLARLELLRDKTKASSAAWYRLAVRNAAILRMRAVLTRVAAGVLVAGDDEAFADARTQLERLTACEGFAPGQLAKEDVAPTPTHADAYPPLSDERDVLAEVVPSYLGIRFEAVKEERLEELGVQRGAVLVTRVYSDTPADRAGVKVDDIVLGPPDTPFDEPRRIKEWTMTSPQATPLDVVVQRDGERQTVTFRLVPFPMKFPSLTGAPQEGSPSPVLPELQLMSGEPLPDLSGQDYLLFFWATWCGPCKAAVPELMAWSEANDVAIVAVTDEEPKKYDFWFKKWKKAFPELVVTDTKRRTFKDQRVSGTPTFVHVGADGVIQNRQRGYKAAKGLTFEGWTWEKPDG